MLTNTTEWADESFASIRKLIRSYVHGLLKFHFVIVVMTHYHKLFSIIIMAIRMYMYFVQLFRLLSIESLKQCLTLCPLHIRNQFFNFLIVHTTNTRNWNTWGSLCHLLLYYYYNHNNNKIFINFEILFQNRRQSGCSPCCSVHVQNILNVSEFSRDLFTSHKN